MLVEIGAAARTPRGFANMTELVSYLSDELVSGASGDSIESKAGEQRENEE
jgi:hypothetical protein